MNPTNEFVPECNSSSSQEWLEKIRRDYGEKMYEAMLAEMKEPSKNNEHRINEEDENCREKKYN